MGGKTYLLASLGLEDGHMHEETKVDRQILDDTKQQATHILQERSVMGSRPKGVPKELEPHSSLSGKKVGRYAFPLPIDFPHLSFQNQGRSYFILIFLSGSLDLSACPTSDLGIKFFNKSEVGLTFDSDQSTPILVFYPIFDKRVGIHKIRIEPFLHVEIFLNQQLIMFSSGSSCKLPKLAH